MFEKYVKKILDTSVYDVAVETPIDRADFLSARLKNNILIKREDLQPVFSFKIRGAYNKIKLLNDDEKKRGVIAASAGNHAQGVALSASKLGIKSRIVMSLTTSEIKVDSVRKMGAEVILYGDTFDEAYIHARDLSKKDNSIFIHPYDDPDVIAGQGTIGMEMLRQYSKHIDAIFVPVGGGGLIGGISVFVKYLRPEIKIIGVEADNSACLYEALKANERVVLPQVGLFADGVAVAQVGEEPFKLAGKYVDEVIRVSTDEICGAIKDIFDDTRSIAEPAGALALAGLKKYIVDNDLSDKTLIAVNSGANVNFDRLRHIAERSELGEKREAIMAVTIPEQPGSFRAFCETLGNRDITEFNYRYAEKQEAHIFVGVRMKKGDGGRKNLVSTLTSDGYKVVDMTDNEIAKIHIRYMVGGHAHELKDEVMYLFEFPERPGALLKFLDGLGHRWNISMFHYRNHGAAYGRVLMGLQISQGEKKEVTDFLNNLGYRYWEDSDNPAYRLFLA